jgi:hypothetical protein
MGTRRPRRGARLCRRCALRRRGNRPRHRQILCATNCEKLSESVIGSRITSQWYSACSILAADRYGDDTIARDEDVNDFFAKWINKLLVDELIAHLEDDIGTVDESATDNLQDTVGQPPSKF